MGFKTVRGSQIPLWFLKSVNIYGEPIYVPETATKEEENQIKEQLKKYY